jgi:hypothetical protein
MPVRTQIALDSEAHRRAKRRAADLGISMAEYVRRLVAADLGEQQAANSPEAIFDLGSSPGSDVERDKDEYLAEAVERSPAERTPA